MRHHHQSFSVVCRLSQQRSQHSSSSVDPSEVLKFSKAAQEWWNPSGEFGLLHRMNPVRTRYVRDFLTAQNALCPLNSTQAKPFQGLKMLDVGCGGGILSEALARLGASVMAIDASSKNIGMAKAHASLDPDLTQKPIDYQCLTAGMFHNTWIAVSSDPFSILGNRSVGRPG